jgi:hypothetical protein
MNEGQPQAQTSTQQADKPSIGQRIMNIGSPGSGGSDTQPVIGALPGMEPYNQATLGKIAGSTDSAGLWLEKEAQRERQVNQEAHNPVDRRDPKYRMGIGQRILGSLVNFGSGFSNNHLPTVDVGPGAVNRRYYQDQQQREDDAAASDARLKTLDSAKARTDELHDQLMNPAGSTQRINVDQQQAAATADESAPSAAPTPLTLYERAVRQAAQEGDPTKAEWDQGLRMMERLQQGRERSPTDELTQSEMKLYNDQAYGVNQRIEALEKAERTPEIDAALQKYYQQRDAIANGIKARRKGHR